MIAMPCTKTPDRAAVIEELRARLSRLEAGADNAAGNGPGDAGGVFSTGCRNIDDSLAWGGLPRGRLHEIAGGGRRHARGVGEAATAWAAGWLARLTADGGAVLWCARDLPPHGPGLAALGFDPRRLIVVRAGKPIQVLWAMEEGLRSGALAAVVGEAAEADLTATRRLGLAAGETGTTALLLRPLAADDADEAAACLSREPSAAVTRWHVAGMPGGAAPYPAARAHAVPPVGRARWRVALTKCRGGTDRPLPSTWTLEWRHETGDLTMVADPAHRSPGDRGAATGSVEDRRRRLAG